MAPQNAPQAVFLDRDGTLIEHVHYLHQPDQVVIRPGTRQALRQLQCVGTRLFLFTNQSGISRGLFSMADAEAVNRRMVEMLDLGPELFTAVCVAPELPEDEPVYRKPSPRFIKEMLAMHAVPKARAWMVGDSPVDWEAGINAGVQVAAVVPDALSPKAFEQRVALGVTAYSTLLEWVESILR
jgi:D-glycero-D-manno-heptose 1,7-bisphosphate phosphatase